MKILIIEDEENLNKSIAQTLSHIAKCDSAFDGEMGLALAERGIYDLILLDLMLPKMNGIEVLSLLRRTSNCPVIVLTAIDDVTSKIKGLKLGADDYITKPFDNTELIARCEAVLRRYNNVFNDNVYEYKSFVVDFLNKKTTYNGELTGINGKLYEILEYLIRNKDIVLPKEQIFNRIWGFDSDTILTVVDVYISKIRKILDKYPDISSCIQTIKKVGYMWSDK